MAPDQLIEAVLGAGRGEPLIPPSMASRLLRDLVGAGEQATADPLADLSDRERKVLALLAEGLRNREIAERLVISEATVKTHVRHVLEKLRFRNRAEAAAFAALSRVTSRRDDTACAPQPAHHASLRLVDVDPERRYDVRRRVTR
jgi:DNA-binding NarL/FixJ family response regulator